RRRDRHRGGPGCAAGRRGARGGPRRGLVRIRRARCVDGRLEGVRIHRAHVAARVRHRARRGEGRPDATAAPHHCRRRPVAGAATAAAQRSPRPRTPLRESPRRHHVSLFQTRNTLHMTTTTAATIDDLQSDTWERDGSNELLVGGLPLSRVVDGIGQTPCYLYDRARLSRRAAALKSLLPARVRLHYAVKANPMPALVCHMAGLVDGLDVASRGELRTALDAGMSPE